MNVRRFFEDRNGRVVLWQAPNAPLLLWGVAFVAERLLSGRIAEIAGLVAFGALFAWAWLEVAEGASPFRRLLGLVVAVGAIAMRLR